MIVADTDVLIDFLAGWGLADLVASELERGTLCTTVVTRFELLCGARNRRQETMVRQLLQSLPAMVLDQESADRAADLRRSLDLRGEGIGMADSLIAGIALVHDAFLLTGNIRHFNRVLGLRLAEIPEV